MTTVETCNSDTPWKAKARKHQSDFREQEMKVDDIANETLADEEFAEIIAKNHLEPREYKTGFTRITDKAAL